ncbi:MAG: nucleotidyltransferase domain-containing protein [Actinobacteria bacterium]|nr:nucleotidyltransferase domain-containing protein [Actinomycetota bacterium]
MDSEFKNRSLLSLLGRTRLAILSLLFSGENREYHFREIVRGIGVGQGATQRELSRLTGEGFLERRRSGNRVYYRANPSNPLFEELQALIMKSEVVADHNTGRTGVGFPSELLQAVAEICAGYHVSRLLVFGSSLRGEDAPGSDLDLLVEFEDGHVPGLDFFILEDELSQALGRKVDLSTPGFLSRYFRDDVMREAQEIYAA